MGMFGRPGSTMDCAVGEAHGINKDGGFGEEEVLVLHGSAEGRCATGRWLPCSWCAPADQGGGTMREGLELLRVLLVLRRMSSGGDGTVVVGLVLSAG